MDCTEIQEQLHGSEEVYADVPLPGRFKPVFHSRVENGLYSRFTIGTT